MSIRAKIGLGFAVLIVLLTSVISWWAARSLGITIEDSDQEKLNALRNELLVSWHQEHVRLNSLTKDIATAFTGINAGIDRERAIEASLKLKRSFDVDWIDIMRDGHPLLFPSVNISAGLTKLNTTEIGWPIRLTIDGPLSDAGFLVAIASIPQSDDLLLTARRPNPLRTIAMACLWDENGLLAGHIESFTRESLPEYQIAGRTFQRIQHGRLARFRCGRMSLDGPWLLVGYETDVTNLTHTSVNALMLQLAILEVVGLLILGYFLGGRLFGPLERLKRAIERVAAGHWQEIPDAGEEDEIGSVASSFNRMVRELSLAQKRVIDVQKELMLKEKMAMLGRFSAGVAHEINNPLGTILVSAGMARESFESGKAVEREDLEAIIEETKRCKAIVNSLLRYARNRPPELRVIQFNYLFERLLSRVSTLAQGSRIKLTLPSSADLPQVEILADDFGVEQVLNNLITNAIDAVSDTATPEVEIKVEQSPQGNEDIVVVTVSDNGPGMGGVSERLFEPFFTTKEGGTGLGLAICQSIIEGHGGRIWAERSADTRTLFHFSLRKAPAKS
ncbi:MAG: HAMP domain-containing protein [Candidatus Riflebacteria bacterium]|nr:HAMP domain-containing protein [Candidatus Riflebacteria bacterium]